MPPETRRVRGAGVIPEASALRLSESGCVPAGGVARSPHFRHHAAVAAAIGEQITTMVRAAAGQWSVGECLRQTGDLHGFPTVVFGQPS